MPSKSILELQHVHNAFDRRCIPVCLLVLIAALRVNRRGAAAASEFDSMRTPSAPAFSVLDIEPSAVERPATPSDAAVALVNNFREGTVPKNFAFESSPYWLVSRPHVSWRDDAQRTVAQSLARTSSVSVATAETGTELAPVSSLAFGFRTLIFSGRLTAQTVTADREPREAPRRERRRVPEPDAGTGTHGARNRTA